MIDERFDKLSIKDKDSFASVLNKLLRVNFILRDVYSTKEGEMKINYDYRFLERNLLLFEDYLILGGWQLNKDGRFGVIYVTSNFEYNRKRMNKFTTIILLTLRLIYDEEREKLTLKREVTINVHTLVQKMLSLGVINKKPSKQELHVALRELDGYHIVQKIDGTWGEAETRFIIYPSILFLLTNARINELYELIDDTTGDEELEQLSLEGGNAHEDI